MFVKREILKLMRYIIDKFPTMSITGPRQSGKSWLIKNEFTDFKYFNLEDKQLLKIVAEDPKGFLNGNGDKIAFDEAQNLPDLFSAVQVCVDENPKKKIILSGSQSFLLHEKIAQSLAGRIGITNLLPFSIKELQNGKFATNKIEDLIFTGCYPRIYEQNIDAPFFYPNYIQTYVERDVRTLKNISNLSLFTSFLKLCAGRIGQPINYASISNDLGVSLNTIRSWINILETSFIAFELKSYYKNFNKRIIKSGKLYFYDTGLACSLLGLNNAEQYKSHYLKGGLFENFVILEIMKHHFNNGKNFQTYFWQDSNKNEVDLIIEVAGKTFAFEIKSSKTWHKDFSKNLIRWNELSKNPTENAAVIYGGNEELKMKGIKYLSCNGFLNFLM